MRMMEKAARRREIQRQYKIAKKSKNIFEGKGVVYSLISDSEANLVNALKMAKRNKKMKLLVPSITKALEAIRSID